MHSTSHNHRTNRLKPWHAFALACLGAMYACSTVKTPGTSSADIATIVVATQRAAPTWTASPVILPTQTIAPTATFTAVPGTPVAPTRIGLLYGATSAVVAAHLGQGESQMYVVRGRQAQPMLVSLDSTEANTSLSIMSQGGTFFLRPGVSSSWRGTLPQSGDYYLGVHSSATPTDYQLSVQLVTPIRFKEGESAATVSGTIPQGTTATYCVFALKTSNLVVTLSGAGADAVIGIVGFVDAVTYLSSSDQRTSYNLKVPVTQDYILEIVPRLNQRIPYVLDVRVE